ncbi:MAG: hydroxymethylbilane synthase [Planctomycetes bacterium]|nr:hydroxymethylbilane synthase [Planctomycetota bacterium]
MKLTLGTRGSALALAQARWVTAELRRRQPGLEVAEEILHTRGDKVLDVPLSQVGGKGLFTKELDSAILDRRIDFAVHSLKDLPTDIAPGLVVAAIPVREDPRDVAVVRGGERLDALPRGARVGTSSLRRQAQLRAAWPALVCADVRGNVDTRLRKLDAGEYDALLLAHAGLRRLGLAGRVTEVLAPERMLPATGQGCLAIVACADAEAILERLRSLHDEATARCARAERALLARLEGGCQIPAGALAEPQGEGRLRLRAVVASLDGARVLRAEAAGPDADPDSLAQVVYTALERQGATDLVRELRAATH